MKIDKSDIQLLFAPASRQLTAAAPASAADAPPAAHAVPAHDSAVSLVATLKRVTPALWRKVGPGPLTRKEKRVRLLALLEWFCSKNGLHFAEGTRQYYFLRKMKVEGRLHATIASGTHSVALELCFELDEAVAYKLRNAYIQGSRPLLLWLGPPRSRAELLAKVSLAAGAASHEWLDVLSLDEPSVRA